MSLNMTIFSKFSQRNHTYIGKNWQTDPAVVLGQVATEAGMSEDEVGSLLLLLMMMLFRPKLVISGLANGADGLLVPARVHGRSGKLIASLCSLNMLFLIEATNSALFLKVF